ncbi:hypothetical protein AYL99_09082 [Fonsecaea erecta]|uniref:5'-3' DNA helicase ZGRF1-like N-terminal domain-containing protein n=1 Tax=Fonsecaea erecta TaxID=1367422 RepID=A0A178ZB19_9EURO|nr:hypothetical protein AYL99_09082 [Fonsecaea erecta]OAP56970.1 hypothetical protein AYL99_09082 [Fonsecaea erecta]
MTTLTSTHRGFASTSLTVAPTQNTAPVHEFRCLYTRDLHKKAKKWHDGSLRFRTFNRRVMVYDDAKNYIGDLHYRQEEEFAEGVEIQLDRGVMVEVGERLGETQTDLAPILERPRPERPPPPQLATTAMASRPLSTGFPQRPKSLLEVLGPSQGRLGRARIPTQSPFEQRWSSSRAGPVESPQKRQRLDSDKENQFDQGHPPVRPTRPRLPQPVQLSQTVPPTPRRAGSPVEFEQAVELSSDDESTQPPTKATRPGTGVVCNQRRRTVAEQLPVPEQPPHARPWPLPRVNARKEKASREMQKKAKAPGNPKTSTNEEPSKSRISRLLIGQPRPRPKLTCVLPFVKNPSRPQTLQSPCRHSSQGHISSPLEEYVSMSARQDVQANVDDCVESIQPTCSGQSSTHGPVQEEDGSCSPLFIPEEHPKEVSPSPPPLPTQEEFPFPGSDNRELSESPAKSSVAACLQAEQVAIPTPQLDIDTRASASKECPGPQPPLVVHQHPPSQRDLLPGPPNGSDGRQLRRVFSENDVVEDDGFTLIPEPAPPHLRSPLKVLDNVPVRKSPSKLQRCASDTSTLDADNHHMEELTEDGTKGPTGPWTEDEAFLLFDWWPADMEKPVYWKDTTANVLPRVLPVTAADVRAGITTARQYLFLRNEVDVL